MRRDGFEALESRSNQSIKLRLVFEDSHVQSHATSKSEIAEFVLRVEHAPGFHVAI